MKRNIRNMIWAVFTIIAFCICWLYSLSFANPWYEQDPAIKPGIEDFDWPPEGDPKYEDIACGHVALTNVLLSFDKQFPSLVPESLHNEYDLMVELVGWLGPDGVENDTMIIETIDWFRAFDVGLNLEHQSETIDGIKPTWDFYQEQLIQCEIPILLITWNENGEQEGHWLVGAGWANNNELRPDFIFHDPNIDDDDATFYDYTLESDGYMHLIYPLENTYVDAKVTDIIAISAYKTPEPTTMLLLGSGLLGLAGYGRKKLFKK